MNAVDPQAYLRDVLSKIVARHPMRRADGHSPICRRPKGSRPNNTAYCKAVMALQLLGLALSVRLQLPCKEPRAMRAKFHVLFPG
jgi:hypothetical protein